MVQLVWVVRLVFPPEMQLWSFWIAALLEMLVPIWAERRQRTPWHPHHVAERFGLFTLILLGESLLASANAIIDAGSKTEATSGLIVLAVTGLLIAAGMWWMYFGFDQGDRMAASRTGFGFGYGHYFLFAAAGAASAGIEVELDLITGEAAHLPATTASTALAVPVALFMVSVWALLLRTRMTARASFGFVATAALILASIAVPLSTVTVAAVCVVGAVVTIETQRTKLSTGKEE